MAINFGFNSNNNNNVNALNLQKNDILDLTKKKSRTKESYFRCRMGCCNNGSRL